MVSLAGKGPGELTPTLEQNRPQSLCLRPVARQDRLDIVIRVKQREWSHGEFKQVG